MEIAKNSKITNGHIDHVNMVQTTKRLYGDFIPISKGEAIHVDMKRFVWQFYDIFVIILMSNHSCEQGRDYLEIINN